MGPRCLAPGDATLTRSRVGGGGSNALGPVQAGSFRCAAIGTTRPRDLGLVVVPQLGKLVELGGEVLVRVCAARARAQ
jgi:hypothetical protein